MIQPQPRYTLFPYTTLFRSWYQKAAENGNIVAQNNLGWLYQNRFETEKNLEKAFYLYQKSAKNGNIVAQNNLGDRKSTRLNSSHSQISYAVFCLKKKKMKIRNLITLTTVLYLSCSLISVHLDIMLMELTKRC